MPCHLWETPGPSCKGGYILLYEIAEHGILSLEKIIWVGLEL
jgi:hypothetical protein